jgi:hypothetical protein
MGHKHSKQIDILDSPPELVENSPLGLKQYSSSVPKQRLITYQSSSSKTSNGSMAEGN